MKRSNETHRAGRRPVQINEDLVCGHCGSERVQTRTKVISFPYGNGTDAVTLKAKVPIRKCLACGRQFLDWQAEDAEHEAVCRHLGVLSPAEIVALRESLGLSRAEFAELTELGDATVARWERGEIVQNKGYDRYLRLLRANPANIDLLRRFRNGKSSFNLPRYRR